MWRFIIPAAIFAVLVGFFVVALNRDPAFVPSPLLGKPGPAYTLPKVEDMTVQVSHADMLGKRYLVNVWATWCGECRHEHGLLMQMAAEKVAPIVGIDWKDELGPAQQWLQQLGNPYVATGFDAEGRTAINFGVYGAPETFLIDEHGTVLCKHVGALNNDVWQRVLKPVLLNQQPDKTLMGTKTSCAS